MQRTAKRGAPPQGPGNSPKRLKSTNSTAPNTGRRKEGSTPTPFINTAPSTRLEVFVFGEGSAGELGLGDAKNATDVKLPRLNKNLDPETVGVVNLSAGGMHAVALTHDNQILTWGINDAGTLCRDTNWDGGLKDMDAEDDSDSDDSTSGLNPFESTPTAIPADKFPRGIRAVQVAAGDSTTFVLTDEGLVYAWGEFRDHNGPFGFYLSSGGEVIKHQKTPMLIPELKDITNISIGGNYCLALNAKGAVFAFGTGDQGQLGRRLVSRRRNTSLRPALVEMSKKIVSIHAGANHAFAIDINGDTWGWGLNNFAQTGIIQGAGEEGNAVFNPQRVKSLIGKNMKMVEGGSHHSVGVTHGGDCYVWGRMDGAQMGLDISQLPLNDPGIVVSERGRPRILLQPTRLPVSGCVFADAGPDHNIVVTSEGKAYSWGFNATYQCGQRTSDDIPVAKLIDNTALRDKKLCWAGTGGQYSFLAAPYKK